MQNKLKKTVQELYKKVLNLKNSQKAALSLLGIVLLVFGFAITIFAGNQIVTDAIGQVNLTCPNGGVLNGSVCTQPLTCPTGYVFNLSNNLCEIQYLSFTFCEFANAKGSRTQTFANGGFGGFDPLVVPSPQDLSANCNANNGIPFGSVVAAKSVNLNFQSGRYLNLAICDYEGKGGVHYQTFFSTTSGGVDPIISNSSIQLAENCPDQINRDLELDNKKSLSLDLYSGPILNLAVCDYKDDRSNGTAMFQTMADNRDGGEDPVVSDRVIDLASSCDRSAGDHDKIYARRNLAINIRQPGICPGGTVLVNGNGNACSQPAVTSNFVLGVANIGQGDCNQQSYNQNTFFNCNFPLTGSPSGQYILPTTGIQAALPFGTIANCQVNAQTLSCNGIGADINIRNTDSSQPRFGSNVEVLLTDNNWSTYRSQTKVNVLPFNQLQATTQQASILSENNSTASLSSSQSAISQSSSSQVAISQNSSSSTSTSPVSSASQQTGSNVTVGVRASQLPVTNNVTTGTNVANGGQGSGSTTVRSGGFAMLALLGSSSFGIGGTIIYKQVFQKRNRLKTY